MLSISMSNPSLLTATDVNRWLKEQYIQEVSSRAPLRPPRSASAPKPERPSTSSSLPDIFDNACLPPAVRQGRAKLYNHDMHLVPRGQPWWSGHHWVRPASQRDLATLRRPDWNGRAGGKTTYQPAGHAELREVQNPMLKMNHFYEQAQHGASALVPSHSQPPRAGLRSSSGRRANKPSR